MNSTIKNHTRVKNIFRRYILVTLSLLFIQTTFSLSSFADEPKFSKDEEKIAELIRVYVWWRKSFNHPAYPSENEPFRRFIPNNRNTINRVDPSYLLYLIVGYKLKMEHGFDIDPSSLTEIEFNKLISEAKTRTEDIRRGIEDAEGLSPINKDDNMNLNEDLDILDYKLWKGSFIHQVYDILFEGNNNSVAFLIEGSNFETFPEIKEAFELAEGSNATIFGSIHSYDFNHIRSMITDNEVPISNETEELYSAYILTAWWGLSPIQDIAKNLIIYPYKEMMNQGVIKEIPKFVTQFSLIPETMPAIFLDNILKNRFDGDVETFRTQLKMIADKFMVKSNEISRSSFMQYLNDHRDITKIYGLIGRAHISFLDNSGKVIHSSEKTREIEIKLETRTINVFLIGGEHGDLDSFNLLKQTFERTR